MHCLFVLPVVNGPLCLCGVCKTCLHCNEARLLFIYIDSALKMCCIMGKLGSLASLYLLIMTPVIKFKHMFNIISSVTSCAQLCLDVLVPSSQLQMVHQLKAATLDTHIQRRGKVLLQIRKCSVSLTFVRYILTHTLKHTWKLRTNRQQK